MNCTFLGSGVSKKFLVFDGLLLPLILRFRVYEITNYLHAKAKVAPSPFEILIVNIAIDMRFNLTTNNQYAYGPARYCLSFKEK